MKLYPNRLPNEDPVHILIKNQIPVTCQSQTPIVTNKNTHKTSLIINHHRHLSLLRL